MNEESRLSNPQLFARWAGEDFDAWRQVIGMSVRHLSRGTGSITDVSREAGIVSIHVHYARAQREHPLWEFRTEVRSMTLPDGITREDLISVVKARQLPSAGA